MAERGVTVSYKTAREWCLKFCGTYTKRIRSRRGRLGDRSHLDEVFLRINGKLQYLWRGRPGRRGTRYSGAAAAESVRCRALRGRSLHCLRLLIYGGIEPHTGWALTAKTGRSSYCVELPVNTDCSHWPN